MASILEDKRILREANFLKAEAIVVELMSLQPDCLFAESSHILKPQILVITNVRLDHLAQMGKTKERIAESLSAAIPSGCRVFVPEGECYAAFKKAARKKNSVVSEVGKKERSRVYPSADNNLSFEFEQNISLARAVCESLSLEEEKILEGIKKARPDFGSLRAWRMKEVSDGRDVIVVNAFAANDPESTAEVVSIIKKSISTEGKQLIGLLNLRSDRGDRTLQWRKAIERGEFDGFDHILLVGGHAHALKRMLRKSGRMKVSLSRGKSTLEIMSWLSALRGSDIVFVGMGNMSGVGMLLVSYWEENGVPYAL